MNFKMIIIKMLILKILKEEKNKYSSINLQTYTKLQTNIKILFNHFLLLFGYFLPLPLPPLPLPLPPPIIPPPLPPFPALFSVLTFFYFFFFGLAFSAFLFLPRSLSFS